MKQRLLAILFLSVSCFFAAAGTSLSPPSSAVRGEPGFFILSHDYKNENIGGFSLHIEYSDKSLAPVYYAVEMTQKPYGGGFIAGSHTAAKGMNKASVFLAAFPVRAPLGLAKAVVLASDGSKIAECSFEVKNRIFSKENLYLNSQLTSLRIDPDPIKTEQAKRYQELLGRVDPMADYLDSAFVSPLDSNRITTEFGLTRHYLYSNGKTDVSDHNGIDYGSPAGTLVYAAGRGRVVMAENRIVTGKTVILEHLPGTYTIYMHLADIYAEAGKILKRGAVLGTVGMTGLATGPHLHWELRINGQAVDPEAMLGKWPVF